MYLCTKNEQRVFALKIEVNSGLFVWCNTHFFCHCCINLLLALQMTNKTQFQLRLVRTGPKSEAFKESFDASHTVYKHYQMGIHKDPPSKPNKGQYTRFLCDSPLAVNPWLQFHKVFYRFKAC